VTMTASTCTVDRLNPLGYNDNERRAYEDTCSKGSDEA
jgi:hypothetical protein